MTDKTIDTATQQATPNALMLLSSHCVHCPSVLDSLSKLIKSGDIGELTIINLEQNPDAMQQYNTRSVPWVRIGKHELTGAQTLDALKQRVDWATKDLQSQSDNNGGNSEADFDFLLSDGQVNKVIKAIKQDETLIKNIMALLGDSGTVLSTRIGIGVVFEEFAGMKLIQSLTLDLGALTTHDDVRIRADALHYLGMTADKKASSFLKAAKNDNNEENREIAADSLEGLFDTDV